MAEDEMVGWHHQLNRHEFGWTLGVGDGQRGLACCSPWGSKESNMTELTDRLTLFAVCCVSKRHQETMNSFSNEFDCHFLDEGITTKDLLDQKKLMKFLLLIDKHAFYVADLGDNLTNRHQKCTKNPVHIDLSSAY